MINLGYQEKVSIPVVIKGVILVPGKIMVGVCFPDAQVQNEHPHMTLLLGSKSGYKAVHSNTVLSATCSSDQRFKGIYNRLKDKNFYEQSVHECQNVNV